VTASIDIHSHSVPRGWPKLPGTGPNPWLDVHNEKEATIMVGSKEFRRITSNAWDAELRLADMDIDNVELQVISPTPVFFSYDRDPAETAAIARIFNDLALEITAPHSRLLSFCQVPLQDTDKACAELDRCIANGHMGVEIGNHVGDRDLDDQGLVTFLQHCASQGIPVFVHPWDMPSSPRLNRWMAQWLTGMPAETHLSILSMILGGVFDRIGHDLRIAFAHGGGSFAYWLGRLENAWRERNDIIATSALPPSQYLDRFSVDSVVFDTRALRLLVDTMGVGQIMVGSDYPYPLGERPAAGAVRNATFLTEPALDRILQGNARTYLGLDKAR
jgi:aminocarboxymuconate-semialdehyde decarboxylase